MAAHRCSTPKDFLKPVGGQQHPEPLQEKLGVQELKTNKPIPEQVYSRWVGKSLSNENPMPTLRHCCFPLSSENSGLEPDQLTLESLYDYKDVTLIL